MRKKRYCLYLSRPLANKLEQVAIRRKRSKSAFLEDALRQVLEPEAHPGVEEALLRRLDRMSRSNSALERELFVIGETLALLVRYFLTITPPLASSEQEAARLLGKECYQHELWGNGPYPPRTIIELDRLNQDDIVEVEGTFYAPIGVSSIITTAANERNSPESLLREYQQWLLLEFRKWLDDRQQWRAE